MQRKAALLILAAALLFLPACRQNASRTTSGPGSEYGSVQKTLEYLTSDECNGRLVGTDGNLTAQKYIMDSLSSFGIEKYNGKYEDQFLHNQLTVKEITLETPEKKFEYGKDFTISKIADSNITCPLAAGTNITDGCVVLLENRDKVNELLSNPKVKAILVKTDLMMLFNLTENIISDKAVLLVMDDAYEYLKKHVGTGVTLKSSYALEERYDSNIIGMIKGKNSKKAILLSAHFDHVGAAGNHIFRGAVDNASGVAALLCAAKRISESARAGKPDTDIIFAFFNAEESMMLGSKDFAERIQKQYGSENILNINIDCISNINNDILNIGCSKADFEGVIQELAGQLKEKSIGNIELRQADTESNSDHVWFDNYVYLYMESKKIHTLSDTISEVDAKLVESVGECAAELVLNIPENKVGAAGEKTTVQMDTAEKIISEEARKLKPFEYKFMKVEGEIKYVGWYDLSGSYDEVNKYFNDGLDAIPVKLLDGTVQSNVCFSFAYADEIEYSSQKLDTVYKRNYQYSDMTGFSIGVFKPDPADDVRSIVLNIFKMDYSRRGQENLFNELVKKFGPDVFEYKEHTLHYQLREGIGGEIKCVSKKSGEQVKYIVTITTDLIESFDKDKIIKLIDDYDMFATCDAIIDFMNQPGEISCENAGAE